MISAHDGDKLEVSGMTGRADGGARDRLRRRLHRPPLVAVRPPLPRAAFPLSHPLLPIYQLTYLPVYPFPLSAKFTMLHVGFHYFILVFSFPPPPPLPFADVIVGGCKASDCIDGACNAGDTIIYNSSAGPYALPFRSSPRRPSSSCCL